MRRIFNRRARYDYQLFEKIEAGIILTGGEVKSLAEGKASLDEAYVKVINGELYLVNAHIHPYQFSENQDPVRTRKLLLHVKEILALQIKMKQKNLILIPLVLYFRKNKAKLEIALAKGKKEYQKKESIKKRDLERRMEEETGGK